MPAPRCSLINRLRKLVSSTDKPGRRRTGRQRKVEHLEIRTLLSAATPDAWWAGEHTFDDIAGVNDGWNVQGEQEFVAGPVGQAFHFDGNDAINVLRRDSSLNPGSGDFTLEGWIQVQPGDQLNPGAVYTNYGGQVYHGLWVSSQKLYFGARDSSNLHAQVYGQTALDDGQWHHFAAIRDGNTFAVYLDGVLDSQIVNQPVGSVAGSNSYARIGATHTTTNHWTASSSVENFLNGNLDEVSFHKRALSAAELGQIVTDGQSGIGRALPDATALYSMDGNFQTTFGVNDVSSVQGTPQFVTGNWGQAVEFDGTESLSVYKNNHEFDPGRGDFTIETWVKIQPGALPTGNRGTVMTNYGGTVYWGLWIRDQKLDFSARDASNTQVEVLGQTALDDGKWHHIAAMRKGNEFSVYVDGAIDAVAVTAGLDALSPSTNNYVRIGAAHSTTNHETAVNAVEQFLNGQLDQTAFHLRALSLTELGAVVPPDFTDPVSSFPVGDTPYVVASADINRDGLPDMVTSNYNSHSITVLHGTGDGTFSGSQDYAMGSGPIGLVVEDFNGDGFADVVTAGSNDHVLTARYGLPDGGLGPEVYAGAAGGHVQLTAADLDDDGDLDLAGTHAHGQVSVWKNDGTGFFGSLHWWANTGNLANDVVAGDVDDDGDADLIVARWNGTALMNVYLNDGTGSYSLHSTIDNTWNAGKLAFEDLDNDGRKDLIATNATASSVHVYLRNGVASFAAATAYSTGYQQGSRPGTADFTGDGVPDVVIGNWALGVGAGNGSLSVLAGRGDGTFWPAVEFDSGDNLDGLTIADWNGDGALDVATTSRQTAGTVNVHTNAADSALAPARPLLNLASTVQSGTSITVTVNMVDPTGALVTDFAGTVSFASSDQQATLPAAVTFTPGDFGSKQVSVLFNSNGTQTLTALLTGSTAFGTTSVFVNSAPMADAGGPYYVAAGNTILLNGSNSSAHNNNITSYEWDFDYDGVSFDIDATGVTPTFDATGLVAAEIRSIGLRVTDSEGLSDIATGAITVSGEVARWKFNDGSGGIVTDSVGSNDGTLTNGPVWVTGALDGALSFDGVNDYVVVPDADRLDPVNELTMEAWVKFDAVDNEYDNIISKGSPDPARAHESYALYRNRTGDGSQVWMGKLSFSVETTSGRGVVRSSFVPNADEWYHLTATYDGSVQRLFVNGQLDGEISHTGTLLNTTSPLQFGKTAWPGIPNYFGGDLDEAALLNRALSTLEVQEQFDSYNRLPTADAGGPYVVIAGSSVTLDGSASSNPNYNITTYEWDFDYDGLTFDPDATGVTTSFDATGLVAAETRQIGLRVTDSDGLADIATGIVEVRGAVSFWQADGDASDSIGANDGALVPGSLTFETGKSGVAVVFDGTDDRRMEVPADTSLELQQFTIDAWVRPDAVGVPGDIVGGTIIGADGTTLAPFGMYGPGSDGRFFFQLGNTDGTNTSLFSSAVGPLDTWTHVAMTWDGSNLRGYINGAASGVISTSGKTLDYTGFQRLTIGEWSPHFQSLYSMDRRFIGLIDNTRVQNRVLTDSEIGLLYTEFANIQPTADAGGPYSVSEGSAVTLDGSGSTDLENNIVSYEWDFDYDGITFSVDASGMRPGFQASSGLLAGQRTIALRVSDAGGLVDLTTTDVTLLAMDPELKSIPAGVETRVNNQTTASQYLASAASDDQGNSIVAWNSGTPGTVHIDIIAQRLDATDQPVGPQFQVNNGHPAEQVHPHAVMADDGRFIIAWQGWGIDYEGWGIGIRRFNADGSAAAGHQQFIANEPQSGYQTNVDMAISPSGHAFVTAYVDDRHDGSGSGIWMRLFDWDANVIANSQINAFSTGHQGEVDVEMNPDGSFVAVWESENQDGSGIGIVMRRFDAAGQPLDSTDRLVNSTVSGDQRNPDLALLPGGDFIVTWTGVDQDGSGSGIYAQRFDTSGGKVGSEFRVNVTTVGDQELPSATVAADGRVVFTWSSRDQDGDARGIFAREFDSMSGTMGPEYQINSTTAGDQVVLGRTGPTAMAPNGDFITFWSGSGPGDGEGVFRQRFIRTNTSPSADAGSPYVVAAGSSVTLDGSASTDPEDNIVSYEWDFDYDGVTFNVDATGVTTSFNAANELPQSRTIALRVTDSGGLNNTAVVSLDVVSDLSFVGPAGYSAGAGAVGMAVVDVNGDGIADLITANQSSDNFSVLLGRGDGTFAPSATYPSGGDGPSSVSAGDIDGDGHVDLAFANFFSSDVSIVWGSSTGAFSVPTVMATDAGPASVAIADLNQDGVSDLVVGNQTAGTVSVYIANGTRSLNSAMTLGGFSGPAGITIVDLNADGAQDLSVSNYTGQSLTVVPGNGDGTFAASTSYPLGVDNPSGQVIRDLDSDGWLDIAVASYGSGAVTILRSQNGVGFGVSTFPSGPSATDVTAADFNQDGRLDLAVANQGGQNVSVFLGNGDATFQHQTNYGVTANWPTSIEADDFDGDGVPDFAVSVTNGVTVYRNDLPPVDQIPDLTASAQVSLGTTATFTVEIRNPDGSTATDFVGPVRFRSSDLEAIIPDIYTFSAADGGVKSFEWTPGTGGEQTLSAQIESTNGRATGRGVAVQLATVSFFGPAGYLTGSGSGQTALAKGDLNGDGVLDLVDASFYDDTISVLFGNGDGTFAAAVVYSVQGDGPTSVTLEDIDSDGHLDVVAANALSDTISLLWGSATGSLSAPTAIAVGDGPSGVFTGDFNEDSRPDIVVSHQNDGTISTLAGTGTRSLALSSTIAGFSAAISPTVADLNADGHDDIVLSNYQGGSLSILSGLGDGSFAPATTYPLGVATPSAPHIADLDGDGWLDIVIGSYGNGTVSILRSQQSIDYELHTFPSGPQVTDVTTADFNQDGHPDLAVANQAGQSASVFLGNGDATFQNQTNFGVTAHWPTSIEAGDFNGDGVPEFAVSVTNGVTVYLDGINASPAADAGGPYEVDEGSSVALDGSGSSDQDGAITTYEWDFDYDGVTFDVDASGVTPVFNAAALDGPGTRTIALRVTDDGGLTDIAASAVSVHNVAPTIESVSAAGARVSLQDSLTHWWTGDADASDQIGTADGTLQNGALAGVSGQINGAFQFDGINDVIQLGNVADFDYSSTDSFTFEAWAKSDGPNYAFTQIILSSNYGPSATSQTIGVRNDGRPYFFVRDAANVSANLEASPLPFGTWNHIVGVRTVSSSERHLYLYVNGVLAVDRPDPTNSTYANNVGDAIGRNSNGPNLEPFNGLIDEVRTYNRALSSNEVAARYLNADYIVDVGSDLSLSATASDPAGAADPLTYEWDFGDGSTPVSGIDLSNVAHTYTTTGNFTVQVTVDDGDGGVAVREISVTVVDTAPEADAGGPYSLTKPGTIPLDATASTDLGGNIATYEWDFDYDGVTFDVDASGAQPVFDASGVTFDTTYQIAVRVTDSGALSDIATTTITIDINEAPVPQTASFTGDEDTVILVDLRTLVTDVDTPPEYLTFSVSNPVNGSVSLLADGHTAQFLPDANYHGPAAFDYFVTDPGYVVHADSVAEFSGVQGQDNWSYGYAYGLVGAFNPDSFSNLPVYDNGLWRWTTFYPPSSWIRADRIHPAGGTFSGWADSMTIRRWEAEVNGDLTVDMDIYKLGIGGNGVLTYLLHEGSVVWNTYLSGGDSSGVTPSIVVPGVSIGDRLDLAIAPHGNNDQLDWTYFTGLIWSSGDAISVGPTTISLTIDPVADLGALNDTFSVNENDVLSATVASNDSTTSGGALSFVSHTSPEQGTLNLNSDGTFTYAPEPNYDGTDSFAYTVTDSAAGESATRLVSITVNHVNDPPVADAGGPYSVDQGTSLSLDGSASLDPDGDSLTYEWDLDFDGVTFDVDATGEQPTVGTTGIAAGTYQIALRVADAAGAEGLATTQLDVIASAKTITFSQNGFVALTDPLLLELQNYLSGAIDEISAGLTALTISVTPSQSREVDLVVDGSTFKVTSGVKLLADTTHIIEDPIGNSSNANLNGTSGTDFIFGLGGADVIRPGAGLDYVFAGSGNDRIEVLGSEILNDVLIGGASFDQLINLDGNQDLVVKDFDSATNGIERIDAAGAAIAGTEDANLFHFVSTELRNVSGVSTLGGDDIIHASNLTHDITYDAGAGNDDLFGGSRRDILIGGLGNDSLLANGNRDVLVPGAGDDIADGGTGDDRIEVYGSEILNDVLIGGANFDQLINLDGNQDLIVKDFDSATNGIERIDAAGAAIVGTEDANLFHFVSTELRNVSSVQTLGGDDIVHASNITHDITYDAGAGNDDLFGGSRRDVLIGGLGNDSLLGNGNRDVLVPGAGDDTTDGGAGDDRIEVYGSEILNDVLVGGANFDQLISLDGNQDLIVKDFDSATNGIERIDAAGAAIVGTEDANLFHFVSTELRNVSSVQTLGGDDIVHASNITHDITYDAGAGNDDLFGGSRRDVLIGGLGNDSLLGNGNRDVLVPGAGDDTADGGAGDDRIEVYGSEILNDVLIGGANFDQLINLDGNQDLIVKDFDSATNGIERIDAAGAAIVGTEDANLFHFVSTELRNVSSVQTLGGDDIVHASNITHDITYDAGAGNDDLFGGSRRDVLIGGLGNDSLLGNGNRDVLVPGAGDDTADGGAGDDRIEVYGDEILNDLLIGGANFDQLISLDGNQDLVLRDFDSATNGIQRIDAAGAAIVGTEDANLFHFVSTELRDVSGVSTFGGDDVIHASNITHDITYDAGAGNDMLVGGSRRDILIGGGGNDDLFGGGNGDRFVVTVDQSNDLIRDMNRSQGDRIDLSGSAFIDWNDFLTRTQATTTDLDQDGLQDDVSLRYGGVEFLRILDTLFDDLEEDWFLF